MPWKAAFNLGACVRKVLPRSRFATLTHTPAAEATNKRIREAPDARLDLLQRSHTTNHRWPHARLIRSLTHKCDTDMRATLPTDRGPFQSQTAVSQPLPGTDTHTAWTAMREHDMECAGARQQSLLHVHAHGHRAYPLPPLPPTAAIAAPGGMQTPSGLHAHTHA
jgi:hypothetical protein